MEYKWQYVMRNSNGLSILMFIMLNFISKSLNSKNELNYFEHWHKLLLKKLVFSLDMIHWNAMFHRWGIKFNVLPLRNQIQCFTVEELHFFIKKLKIQKYIQLQLLVLISESAELCAVKRLQLAPHCILILNNAHSEFTYISLTKLKNLVEIVAKFYKCNVFLTKLWQL